MNNQQTKTLLSDDDKKKTAEKKKLRKSLPTKKTMNLTVPVSKDNQISTVLPVAIVVAIAIALFTKFAVLDRYQKVADKEREVALLQLEVNGYNEQLKDYDTIRDQYYRYTTYFMTDAEVALMNRIDLLDLLTKSAGSNVDITSVSLAYNQLSMTVTAPDLDTVRKFVDTLNGQPNVVKAIVTSATKAVDSRKIEYVTARITMEVTEKIEEEKK